MVAVNRVHRWPCAAASAWTVAPLPASLPTQGPFLSSTCALLLQVVVNSLVKLGRAQLKVTPSGTVYLLA